MPGRKIGVGFNHPLVLGGRMQLEVGSFPPNAFGLYDMHGNVEELVQDCWHPTYNGAPSDGSAWTTGNDCDLNVVRGGSYAQVPELLRSARRDMQFSAAHGRIFYLGFRVARTL